MAKTEQTRLEGELKKTLQANQDISRLLKVLDVDKKKYGAEAESKGRELVEAVEKAEELARAHDRYG